MFKKIQYLYLLNKYIKCNFRDQRCGTTPIGVFRRQRFNKLPTMGTGSNSVFYDWNIKLLVINPTCVMDIGTVCGFCHNK